MARPIWTGTISFGLLNVPVQLYSGERSVDLHFRMLDSRDNSPIRYERVNAESGREVAWKDIVKAFEYRKGSYAVIDEDKIRKAAPEATQTIDIESFVEREAINPVYFEKPYILAPSAKAEKSYVLLREVLKKTGRVGIAKVVIRTRQYLAMLMPQDEALMLNLLRFPQEIVPLADHNLPKGKAADYRVNPREIEMASQLIESMSVPWNPEDYQDDFRDQLRKIVEAAVKSQGTEPEEEEEEAHTPASSGGEVDFMALLKQSLAMKGEAQKTGRAKRAPQRRRGRERGPVLVTAKSSDKADTKTTKSGTKSSTKSSSKPASKAVTKTTKSATKKRA